MDFTGYFRKQDRSYRFMKAGRVFSETALYGGILLAVCSLLCYLASFSVLYILFGAGAVCTAGIFRSVSELRYIKAYESPLYIDRQLKGGERFPALYELLRNGGPEWVTETLKKECGSIISKNPAPVYPLFSGRTGYVFLPYLFIFVMLSLPESGLPQNKTDAPGFTGYTVHSPGNSAEGGKGFQTGEIPAGAENRTDSGVSEDPASAAGENPLTPEEIDAVAALLENPEFRELLKAFVENNRSASTSQLKKVSGEISSGNIRELNQFLDAVEELTGGAGKGAGAGLTDGIRDALVREDYERAAAEFEAFFRLAEKGIRRDIIVNLSGRADSFESYRQGTGNPQQTGAVPLSAGNTARAVESVPPGYRKVVRNYFSIRK